MSLLALSAYLMLLVGRVSFGQQAFFGLGAYASGVLSAMFQANWDFAWWFSNTVTGDMPMLTQMVLTVALIAGLLLRDRTPAYVAIAAMIALSTQYIARGYEAKVQERSFFGVMRIGTTNDPRLGGDPHNFAASLGECEHLGDAGRRVAGVGGDHRLHADRIQATEADISDLHLAGQTALIMEQVRAVAQGRGWIHCWGSYKPEIRLRQRRLAVVPNRPPILPPH
jgi:hypothetical protein